MGLRENKIKKTLVFDKASYEKLQEIALKKDRSISSILRDIIKNYIAKEEEKWIEKRKDTEGEQNGN